MNIPYYQMNSFILNSYKCLYENVYDMKPYITFENYIKSQLHCNIVTPLFNRSILQYNNALLFINGNTDKIKDYELVLKWYYEDLSNIILNGLPYIKEDFSILDTNIYGIELIDYNTINLSKVQSDLEEILVRNNPIDFGEFRYLDILKHLPLDVLEFIKPTRIFSEALAMRYVSLQHNNYYIEVSK